MIAAILALLIAALASAVLTVLVILTARFIKKKVEEILERNRDHKAMFAKTSAVLNEKAKEELLKAKKFTMEELEEMCSDEYIIADYDPYEDKIEEIERLRPEQVDDRLRDTLNENDQILVLED